MPDSSQVLARYAELYRVPPKDVQERFENPWRTLGDVARPAVVLSALLFIISIPCALRRAVRRSLTSLIGTDAASITSAVSLIALVAAEIAILGGRLGAPTFVPTTMFLSAALLIPFLLAFFPASRSVDRMRDWFGALTGMPFDHLLLHVRLMVLKRATRSKTAGANQGQPISKN